jgi:hypothetical protein
MNTWPPTLPQNPYFEFGIEQVAGLLGPEEKNNPVRIRTYPESEAVFRFRQLTLAQIQTLRTFYDVTLNQCAPFSAPWLHDVGFDFHFIRLTDSPSVSRNGRLWDVEIKVEIIAGVPMSGGIVNYWMPEV